MIFNFADQIRELKWHIHFDFQTFEYALDAYFEGEKLNLTEEVRNGLGSMVGRSFEPIPDESIERNRVNMRPETFFEVDANKIILDFLFRLGQTGSKGEIAFQFLRLFEASDMAKEGPLYCTDQLDGLSKLIHDYDNSDEADVRWKALENLRDYFGPISILTLHKALKDEAWFIRRTACRIMDW